MSDVAGIFSALKDAIEHDDWPCAKSYAGQARELLAEGRDAMRELLGNAESALV